MSPEVPGEENPISAVERPENVYLKNLRKGINEKNEVLVRETIDAIWRQINRGDSRQCSPPSEGEIRSIIDHEHAEIPVGSGTHGERIFIKRGELFMNEQSDQRSSQPLYRNFRYFFELEDDAELRVIF
jgi:hypothetical protein